MNLTNFKQKAWTAIAVIFAANIILYSCGPIDGIDDPIDHGTVQDADIVAFSFTGMEGKAVINKSAQTVSAKAKETVNLTDLAVNFTLSLDASATVNGTTQESGVTANDFTNPVTYRVTSGDGQTTNSWTVTISTEGDPGEDPKGDFTKTEFKTVKEVIDFIPEGVWIYEYEDKGWSNDRTLYAKASDGSFTYSEMEGDPKKSNYGDVDLWYVWKGDSYYSLNYTNEYDPDVTHYWKVWARYPGENLLQSTDTQYGLKSINVSIPWGGIPTAMPGETMEPFMLGMGMSLTPFLAFIASDVCSTAVFEENATVEGIACKKYTTAGGTDYYVLDNGFCLQKDGPEGLGSWSDFSIKSATTTAASCDAVLQTYYQDSDVFQKPTTINVQAITQMHNGSAWVAGGWNSNWAAPESWVDSGRHQIYVDVL